MPRGTATNGQKELNPQCTASRLRAECGSRRRDHLGRRRTNRRSESLQESIPRRTERHRGLDWAALGGIRAFATTGPVPAETDARDAWYCCDWTEARPPFAFPPAAA